MRARGLWFGLLGTLASAGVPAPAGAQAVGSEFQVNTYTTGGQAFPSAASDPGGNFVVVWQSSVQDGSLGGIFGQRYDSEGVAQGEEFLVNAYTTGSQFGPAVASDASGNFVVVWAGPGQGDSYGIFGQRYDSDGGLLGNEFRVNAYTSGMQAGAQAASDANGNFVVVWNGRGPNDLDGIFGQRYDSEGDVLGAEFRVNSSTTGPQNQVSVASDPGGNFVVVWQSFGQDGSSGGVFGQRYDGGGFPQGAEFRANSFTTSFQGMPSVAVDSMGGFVITWRSAGQDGDSYGIFAQRYDGQGAARGAEFQVNSYTLFNQDYPSVATDADGNFVVAWESVTQDGGGPGIFAQGFDNEGVAQGAEFRVNSFTTGSQNFPSVASGAAGHLVVAWTSANQDGNGYGIFGQRFDFSGTQTITVLSPNTNVRWRIGSVRTIQWSHNLGADASFRIELDRTDDGTYEELIAAHAPATNATKGSFAWTVTGPPSGTARVRISWTDDPSVSDASDTTFQIRP